MTIIKKHRICPNAILWLFLIAVFGCEEHEKPVYSGETVTDIDGNVYNTVKIGDQLWMAEDLKVTRYNDGTPIPIVTERTAWTGSRSGAYCFFSNEEAWGTLYNWYAVNTGELAPEGWHAPSHQEWTELSDYLGGEEIAGGKLKESGGERWSTPNAGASDEYWFTAIPAGIRELTGDFSSFGSVAYWWSSTDFDGANAWARRIIWNSTALDRIHIGHTHGMSVRCVKD